MSDDPLGWQNIARARKLAGDPAFANWVDPLDPMGWNDIARAQKAAGDPAYANWVDPYAHLLPAATPAAPATDAPAQTPGVDPVTTDPPVAAPDLAAERFTFERLSAVLDQYGLGGLFSRGADGSPSGWLWDQIVNDNLTEAGIELALRQTDEFKARFPAISQWDPSRGAPPAIKDVLDYERTFKNEIVGRAGLPAWMFDEPAEIQSLMLNGLSIEDVDVRLGQAWSRVKDTAPEVRAAFEQFYGVGQGDQALAAFFLDPETTQAKLDKASRVAYASGMGSTLGVGVSRQIAERIADLPMTEAGVVESLRNVAEQQSLLNEGISEATDLTDETAIESTIFGSASDRARLEQRLIERQANERSSFGGGIITQEGLTGVRSA